MRVTLQNGKPKDEAKEKPKVALIFMLATKKTEPCPVHSLEDKFQASIDIKFLPICHLAILKRS